MSHAHPSRGWKGCCGLCSPWWRGDGYAYRLKASDLRRAGGRARRVRRHDTSGGEDT